MAIWVKIRKYSETNGIHYYEVFKQDYETIEFYMGIDIQSQLILFFLNKDLIKPAKIVDFTKKDEIIYPLETVNNLTFTKALVKALKALDTNSFPEILDLIA